MAAVLTNSGEQWCISRLVGSVATSGRYIAWGTGSAAPAKSDSNISSPAAESRAPGTVHMSGTGAASQYVVEGTLTAEGNKTITNIGNFTAPTGGTLIIHAKFDTPINVSIGDAVTFTITLGMS